MSDIKDILKKVNKRPMRERNDHILVIDSMNTFIRSFSIIKAMNSRGQHVGGLIGFLKSLGYMVRTLEPTRVLCVFDGRGSSINRRNINPEYKSNRDNVKVTNWGMYDSREEERESMSSQISRLLDYLECLPVTVISMDKVEADDIMSFIGLGMSGTGRRVTLASSDKDFLQVVRPGLEVYAPIKKKLITAENIKEYLEVSPGNYLITKALLGDRSDNLTGIKGLGIKTLVREFPELVNEEKLDLDFIYKRAEEKIDDKKIFSKIIFDWDKVQQNYKLMNLQETQLDEKERLHIIEKLKEPTPGLSSGTFIYYLEKDLIEGLTKNTEGWLEVFRPLTLNH